MKETVGYKYGEMLTSHILSFSNFEDFRNSDPQFLSSIDIEERELILKEIWDKVHPEPETQTENVKPPVRSRNRTRKAILENTDSKKE